MKLKLFVFTVALAALIAPATVSAQAPQDLALINGTIYTVNKAQPRADALLIQNGLIAAVGLTSEIHAQAPSDARIIDLRGQTVIPGLIDAHGHLINLGFSILRLNVTGTTSYQQILDAVAQRAESAQPGEWVTGRGWDQNDWPEKKFPHHGQLSRRSPQNPVALTRVDGHAMLANAEALRIAGIDTATPDPPGGRIVRDSGGSATGVLVDRAMDLVRRHIPPEDDAQRERAVELAIDQCLKHGLTSIHDPGVIAGVTAADIRLYQKMIDANRFNLRVYAMIRANQTATLDEFFESGPLIAYGADRLTVRSLKAMTDGALGSRGAALLADYADEPGNNGLLMLTRENLAALTQRALRAGFQVNTHSIGDRGNRTALDAYQDALAAVPANLYNNDARLRIEHAQVVALEDIPRFAELGVIPSMQATHATSDMYWAEDRVGPDRVKGAYAWRRFLDSGSRIANGSDFPVEGVNPLWGFYASITRQDQKGWPEGGWYPDQNMTREETLRSFTLDAAYAAFEEDIKGSIEPGKLADLVVLSHDIMKIPAPEILQTDVVMTILGGAIVYER